MRTTGFIIFSLLKDLGIEEKVKFDSLRDKWTTLFGEPLSLHTWPADLRKGELLVNVDSPAWLQQLKFFKKDIIAKLQAYDVTSVKFRHGSIYRQMTRNLTAGEPEQKRQLTDSDRGWIEETIADVQDPELRDNLRKAMGKGLARKQGPATRI
jgi:hypothetical protein